MLPQQYNAVRVQLRPDNDRGRVVFDLQSTTRTSPRPVKMTDRTLNDGIGPQGSRPTGDAVVNTRDEKH